MISDVRISMPRPRRLMTVACCPVALERRQCHAGTVALNSCDDVCRCGVMRRSALFEKCKLMPTNVVRRQSLLNLVPNGLPVTKQWLGYQNPDLDRHAVDNLLKSKQLEALAPVYLRPGTTPHMARCCKLTAEYLSHRSERGRAYSSRGADGRADGGLVRARADSEVIARHSDLIARSLRCRAPDRYPSHTQHDRERLFQPAR